MDHYKKTKYKFAVNNLKYPVFLTRNSKHVVFIEGRKKYVDMSKHPAIAGGTQKRPRESEMSNVSRKAPMTTPPALNFESMPEEIKATIFNIYVDLVRKDMEELQSLNSRKPTKQTVTLLVDKLIAVYNNVAVTKQNVVRMGASQTNSWDDFVYYMTIELFYKENTMLHALSALKDGFSNIVVTYASTKRGPTKFNKMVRIKIAESPNIYSELERSVELIEPNRPKRGIKSKVIVRDFNTEDDARQLFNSMSNLQLMKRVYRTLYIDVPTELQMANDFYVESIYMECVYDEAQFNRWEAEPDSSCYVHEELGHTSLQIDEADTLYTRPLFVFNA